MRNNYLIQLHVSGDVRDRERFLVQLFVLGMRSASTRDHKRREIECNCTPATSGPAIMAAPTLRAWSLGGCAVCKGTNRVLSRRSCTRLSWFQVSSAFVQYLFSLASYHALVHSLLQYFRCT
jgi:hypothetical protein